MELNVTSSAQLCWSGAPTSLAAEKPVLSVVSPPSMPDEYICSTKIVIWKKDKTNSLAPEPACSNWELLQKYRYNSSEPLIIYLRYQNASGSSLSFWWFKIPKLAKLRHKRSSSRLTTYNRPAHGFFDILQDETPQKNAKLTTWLTFGELIRGI